MIRLLIYVVLIIAGLLAGPQLVAHKGYVMISVAEYTVETSLVALVLIALVAFGALQVVEWLLVKAITVTGSTVMLPKRWRRSRAKQHTLSGFLALAEQDWGKAERAMAKGAKAGEAPMINYFAAARAAHQRGDQAAWQNYLEQAEQQPEAKTTAQITRIRYLMEDGDLESSRQQLDALDITTQAKPVVRRLALALYRKQQDWDQLAKLIPLVKRDKSLPEEVQQQLPIEVATARFNECETEQGLTNQWDALPRQLKRESALQVAYANGLLRLGNVAKARMLLLDKLDKNNPQGSLLGALPAASKGAEEEVANILKRKYRNGNNAEVNECMAELAEQRQQFDLALTHRQKALDAEASVSRYQKVIRLQEQLGQRDDALGNYRQMVALMQA